MTTLLTPLRLRGVTLANRIAVSPMCMYSSVDGFADDWHLVHLGSRAAGGAGLVITEATAVTPDGRISPDDLGLWSDDHIAPLQRITRFLHQQGTAAGIQLAHAGRKASTWALEKGHGTVPESEGGWKVWGASPISFAPDFPMPQEMGPQQLTKVVDDFAAAARRAVAAGYDVLDIHAAHGYLLHQFLSPLSNTRTDAFGGSFDNRTRLVRSVVRAVRAAVPDSTALFVRISATDWGSPEQPGWTPDQAVELVKLLRDDGVDLIDTSSGGTLATATIPVGPGYQAEFARQIREQAGIATSVVGMVTAAHQAEHILRSGQADLVLLGREMLRDPHWPLHAAAQLGTIAPWPRQYLRAAPTGSPIRTPYCSSPVAAHEADHSLN